MDREESKISLLSFRYLNNNSNIFHLIIIISLIFLISWYFPFKSLTKYQKEFYLKTKDLRFQKKFISQRRFDIVLSYYAEDPLHVGRFVKYLKNLSSLNKLSIRTIIYNKNFNINLTKIKENLNVDLIYLLPNLGREGATYLYHIIENYNQLADHILFSQAGVEGINDKGLDDWLFDRLENQFNYSTGYMPLVISSMISRDLCGIHITGNFQRLIDLWGLFQQSLCPPQGFSVAFRGQFLVSKQRILRRSLNIYKYLYELLTADDKHWIHTDPKGLGWKSTPEQPVFGYIVERLWTIIFNCTNTDLVDRCNQKKCACFD